MFYPNHVLSVSSFGWGGGGLEPRTVYAVIYDGTRLAPIRARFRKDVGKNSKKLGLIRAKKYSDPINALP